MTTPPTPSQLDDFLAANSGIFQALALNGGTVTIVAWTQEDASYNIWMGDPTTDPQTSAYMRGIVNGYGQVLVRQYSYTVPVPTGGSMAADSATQDFLNDTGNWTAIP